MPHRSSDLISSDHSLLVLLACLSPASGSLYSEEAQKSMPRSNNAAKPIVLQVDKAPQCCQTSKFRGLCEWRRAYALHSPPARDSLSRRARSELRVDVHIRRGDVIAGSHLADHGNRFGSFQYSILMRAIPNIAYLNILRSGLRAILRYAPGIARCGATMSVCFCGLPYLVSPESALRIMVAGSPWCSIATRRTHRLSLSQM